MYINDEWVELTPEQELILEARIADTIAYNDDPCPTVGDIHFFEREQMFQELGITQ